MSLANIDPANVTTQHSQDVLRKFHWAIKRVASEHGNNNETTLTQEELIQLIRAWEPQRDIICLYVRWARQLRRNFNLDSIATLLCLSRQCGYTPADFLRKVKTLSVLKNQKAAYGVTFYFDIPNRKDVDRDRLNKEFLGLSVTLSLLQEQVTNSASILGKTGMRQSGPRQASSIDIAIQGDNNHQAAIIAHPNVEFHTQSSLLNRIWISINHRWLALHVIEHLFREVNGPWTYTEALLYSFQMMAPCGPGRYEFLSPLAGYCLQFRSQESIESNRTRLQEIWKDPASFLLYGNTCLTQFSADAQARIIIDCFQDLQSNIRSTTKKISYHRDSSWLRRWTMIRAYIFHFWLDSAANNAIKSVVTQSTFRKTENNKRKISACYDNDTNTTGPSHGSLCISKQDQGQRMISREVKMKGSHNGLLTITQSRRTSNPSASSTTNNKTPIAVEVHGKIGTTDTQSIPATMHKEGPNNTTIHQTDWKSLRLITREELGALVQSYLLIHRLDGICVLSELAPLEVYSADHLHDLKHSRTTGMSPFFPTGKTGPVLLHINTEADRFIDTYAKSFHVAREESDYFQEFGHHLPSLGRIQSLCEAIVLYGNIDGKRAPGQFRLNIGNGGQHWVDGAPCRLHGRQFQKVLETDNRFDPTDIMQSIGQLTEFTWRVSCAFQNDAGDHPLPLIYSAKDSMPHI